MDALAQSGGGGGAGTCDRTYGESAVAGGLAVPRTRRDLIALLRDHPDRFRGRVGSYDPAVSGAGYLFAAQDARLSDTFWRLAEVMGRLDAKLYCCSGDMIAAIRRGDLLMAYNVLGQLCRAKIRGWWRGRAGVSGDRAGRFHPNLAAAPPLCRIGANPDLAAGFVAYLLSAEGQTLIAGAAGLPAIEAEALCGQTPPKPDPAGSGLACAVGSADPAALFRGMARRDGSALGQQIQGLRAGQHFRAQQHIQPFF